MAKRKGYIHAYSGGKKQGGLTKRTTKKEFQVLFDVPISDTPVVITSEQRELYTNVDHDLAAQKSLSNEHALHVQCVKWLRNTYPDVVVFHARNQSSRYGNAKQTEAGYTPGFPDLAIDFANHGYGGLRVEFKMPGNYPDPEQRKVHALLTAQNYLVQVIRKYDDFITLIDWYLNTSNT